MMNTFTAIAGSPFSNTDIKQFTWPGARGIIKMIWLC